MYPWPRLTFVIRVASHNFIREHMTMYIVTPYAFPSPISPTSNATRNLLTQL